MSIWGIAVKTGGTTGDSAHRFTNRVAYYLKSRPPYPDQALMFLHRACRLHRETVVADIGSGTGILTRQLLTSYRRVYAVEPNPEMRAAAEKLLAGLAGFVSIAATAENTSLPTHGIDVITAAQSFHWFHHERAREEFWRILKPNGWLVLFWNERLVSGTRFRAALESFIDRYATDYAAVNHKNVTPEVLAAFYGNGAFRLAEFDNRQVLDFDGLRNRLLSASYMPGRGDLRYAAWSNALDELFSSHAVNDTVQIDYVTRMYFGHMTGK